jgi:hypothetical protein
MYIKDDDLWDQIMNHELNGFSYQALVSMAGVEIDLPALSSVTGVTEADPIDGHSHHFFVMLDDDGKIISGGTDETNGHTHDIRNHTFTGMADNHVHLFNYVARNSEDETST